MTLTVATAIDADASEIATLRNAVARCLTHTYGQGHWSSVVTDRGVLAGIRTSRVLVARDATRIVATLRLATKKPWAIDRSCFKHVARPLYLTDMAVEPDVQRQGIGRRLLEDAKDVARDWPADAIRLDAYDDAAGAGGFYEKCGFRQVGRRSYRGVPLLYFEFLL
jgi:GNAT superfamily N-acetyltransferase